MHSFICRLPITWGFLACNCFTAVVYHKCWQRFPEGFVYKSPWDVHGLFGVPLTKLGARLVFFVRPLSKLCIPDSPLCIRETMCWPSYLLSTDSNNYIYNIVII